MFSILNTYQTFLWVFELRMNVFAILLKILFEIPQYNPTDITFDIAFYIISFSKRTVKNVQCQ